MWWALYAKCRSLLVSRCCYNHVPANGGVYCARQIAVYWACAAAACTSSCMQMRIHVTLSLDEREELFQPCIDRWELHGCCESQNKALDGCMEDAGSACTVDSATSTPLVDLCHNVLQRLASVPLPQQLAQGHTLHPHPTILQSAGTCQLQCRA
jgi:hypothetical protein